MYGCSGIQSPTRLGDWVVYERPGPSAAVPASGRGTFVTEQDAGVLQMRTSRRVALIVPDMANPFNVEVVGSVEKHQLTLPEKRKFGSEF